MENKLNLTDLIHVAYRWCVLLIAFTLLCGIGTYAYSRFAIQPVYVSSGNLLVKAMTVQEDDAGIGYSQLNANARLAADYVEIIEYESILKGVSEQYEQQYGTHIEPKKIASMLKAVVVATDSALVRVTVTADTKREAEQLEKLVLEVASKRLPEVAEMPGSVAVVEEAKPAEYKKTPPLVHGLIGCIAGLVLGMLLVLFIELMDNRIKQTDDIAQKYNLPVIGVVPNIRETRSSGE